MVVVTSHATTGLRLAGLPLPRTRGEQVLPRDHLEPPPEPRTELHILNGRSCLPPRGWVGQPDSGRRPRLAHPAGRRPRCIREHQAPGVRTKIRPQCPDAGRRTYRSNPPCGAGREGSGARANAPLSSDRKNRASPDSRSVAAPSTRPRRAPEPGSGGVHEGRRMPRCRARDPRPWRRRSPPAVRCR